ncbi:hypothetical protein [Nocardioides panacisoli]|uniref:DUF461 domain-containing protein n=1 Tax=Nocardioides panacisoli TaxID=627624 RepID=A0ABP7IWY9_9ACTN
MLHRRSNARHQFLGALLLTVALGATLSACGGADDFPTNRINQLAAGANYRDGDVKLLGIRVLSSAAGEGRVIGSVDNDSTDGSASLTGITNTDGSAFTIGFQPLEIKADTAVSLSAQGGLPVTGDFKAGDVLSLEFAFADGEKAQLEVPVVKNCYQYTAVPTPSASASASASGSSESASPSSSESASSDSSAGDLYTCSDQESAPSSGSEGE